MRRLKEADVSEVFEAFKAMWQHSPSNKSNKPLVFDDFEFMQVPV